MHSQVTTKQKAVRAANPVPFFQSVPRGLA
jgi:hypothetical protein